MGTIHLFFAKEAQAQLWLGYEGQEASRKGYLWGPLLWALGKVFPSPLEVQGHSTEMGGGWGQGSRGHLPALWPEDESASLGHTHPLSLFSPGADVISGQLDPDWFTAAVRGWLTEVQPPPFTIRADGWRVLTRLWKRKNQPQTSVPHAHFLRDTDARKI